MAEETNDVVRPGEGPYLQADQLWLVADQDLLSLGAELGTRSPRTEAEIWNPLHPLIVGVSSAKSIQRLRQIVDKRDVKAVIAWRLPEEYLGSLYNFALPILIGRPTVQDLLNAVNVGVNSDAVASARKHAAELATLEAVFDQPAGARASETDGAAIDDTDALEPDRQ